jgi:hypothetical protein
MACVDTARKSFSNSVILSKPHEFKKKIAKVSNPKMSGSIIISSHIPSFAAGIRPLHGWLLREQ